MSLTFYNAQDQAPDVAKERIKPQPPIDLVGIQGLKMPVRLTDKLTVPSVLEAAVSLDDPKTRGIHMSRMYLTLHDFFSRKVADFAGLKKILLKIIRDQGGISQSGRLRLASEWPVQRKSLKSSARGWRVYPFFAEVSFFKTDSQFQFVMGGEALYSSTCPCSASLARQIIKRAFEKQFPRAGSLKREQALKWLASGSSLAAVPHAQKSAASFKIRLSERAKDKVSFLDFVEEVEQALGTPVQTAVKRRDEAEFARLSANNLMFCEDAVRRIARRFKGKKNILDYLIQVRHYESLHPFSVESAIAKGAPGGWRV